MSQTSKLNFPQYGIKIQPVKKNYICKYCGRKRIITYRYRCQAGGLLSNKGEQCMPIMLCPRCKQHTMIENKEQEKK